LADLNPEPLYLIVTDLDRRVFAVEGPMIDSRPWDDAATPLSSSQAGPFAPA